MLLTNQLTFNFDRAVTWSNGQQVPELMEVAVIPLANPSFPDQGTYVGGLQTQQVLLTNATNSVSFNLVPTYAGGLSEPVLYRAEWRQGGVTGRTYSQDFSMPAQDVAWDQLDLLGDYVDGTNYVQQSQVGVASGVAALNAQGQVVDATGTPVAEASDISAVNAAIAIEVTNRTNAINALNNTLSTSLAEDIASVTTTTANNLSAAIATVNATATSNFDTLNNAITGETAARQTADNTFASEISSINSSITTINAALPAKADLSGGVIEESQIPPYLILNAYPVSGQGGMLALSNSASNGNLPPVHYADIALWTNGAVWMLVGDPANPVLYPDPSVLSNWVDLTSVYAVNGLTGNVTLTPQTIGAVGAATNGGATAGTGMVNQSQVYQLAQTLSTYATLAQYNSLNTTVNGILNNTNIVYLDTTGPSTGFINHAKLDANVAYVNQYDQVTDKAGNVLAAGTSQVLTVNGDAGPNVVLTAADVGAVAIGGTVPESAVEGLLADLAARVLNTDSRLSDARTPTVHATTHELGGSDALTLDPSQVSGLNAQLAALAPLTTTDAQAAQIASLQSEVTFLLGGGTPTSSPIKAIWFDGPSTFTGVTNPDQFSSVYNVQQKSPFGQSAVDGTYYYNPAGANAGEWVYPYFTPNGHLEFTKWNPSAAADVVYATQSALNSLQNQVNGCATQTQLANLQNQVNASATAASVTTIQNQLSNFATVAQLNSLTTQVGNAATQAALNQTNATVATLATQASVNSLSQTVQGLATQSALAAVQQQVTSNTNTLGIKADLVNGFVPLNEIPAIPMSQVQNLQNTLAAYCPLTAGLVPIGNLPEIPESQVQNLVADLTSKADLVNGQVPSSQLPSLAITNVYTEPNRAGMLGLSAATVGDICVITGTSDEGTYILSATPASTFTNWVLLPNPQNVTSVNGQTGAVNLTAANVGAMATGQAIPISQITNLQNTINGLATTTALTNAVNGLQNQSQVQGTLTTSTMIKQLVNYVATSPISSLAGQQSVDGVLTPLGSVVLATAQPSSINNGLWVVQSGAWTRTTDFATNSYFVRGSLAFVANGQTMANTIWQETTGSGVVDTNVNNWANIMTAGGPVLYTNGNGISLNSSSNSFSLNVVSGGGLAVTAAGATVDKAVVATKYSGYVPAGSTIAPITHNLNTTDVGAVFIKEVATGNQVLACPTITGPNTLTIEFASPPAVNQWRCTILA